jgi:hypothetical protein
MILLFILLAVVASSPAGAWPQKPSSELKIVDVLFEDYDGGLSPHWKMRAGEEVSLSFRVEGFGRLPVESQDGLREERVNLHYQIELRDPLGVLVTPEGQGVVETTLGPQDVKWRPKINWSAGVPFSAPSGDYRVRIRVNDRIANQESVKDVFFGVRGEPVQTSDHLQVIQLGYSNSEGGPWNTERYFSPTESIWVRYRIVGCGFSPEKQVWVEQDWTVLDETGKVVVAQENAWVEKQSSFYPPRFLSTVFNLNLKDPKPGKYMLRIDLRDRIGEQSASLESNFFLRP